MEEGGKVYACRFALQALYGHGEAALIEGIRPINPLDVLDLQSAAPQGQRVHPRHLDDVTRASDHHVRKSTGKRIVRAAAVQIAPDFERRGGTLEKVCEAIDEAAREACN